MAADTFAFARAVIIRDVNLMRLWRTQGTTHTPGTALRIKLSRAYMHNAHAPIPIYICSANNLFNEIASSRACAPYMENERQSNGRV